MHKTVDSGTEADDVFTLIDFTAMNLRTILKKNTTLISFIYKNFEKIGSLIRKNFHQFVTRSVKKNKSSKLTQFIVVQFFLRAFTITSTSAAEMFSLLLTVTPFFTPTSWILCLTVGDATTSFFAGLT